MFTSLAVLCSIKPLISIPDPWRPTTSSFSVFLRLPKSLAAAVLIIFPMQLYATSRMECESVDKADWMTETALEEKLVAEGWKVRRMKVDGECWDVYGTTPEGERVEACFHSATGEKMLVARRGKILFRADGVQ